MKPPGLALENVVKRFGKFAAVDGVSLSVANGEIVALLGPSGCGKTTTLRLIAGFEVPDAGRICVGGFDVERTPAFRRDIGLVFQDYALFPHMTVAQNVDYGMRQRGIKRFDRDRRRRDLLHLVRLEGLDDRRPEALSGGQQQRVALARALAISPRVLLLDEPLSNLDARLRETLRQEICEILRAAGATTLVVTHDQMEAIGIANRIALMDRGRIVQIGSAREIYEEPATRFVAQFVGQSIWFSGYFESDDNRWGRFRTDDGLVFAAAGPAAPATRYGLSIRPQYLHLNARANDVNRIAATVERIDYFGEELVVHCRVDLTGRVLPVPIRSDHPTSVNPGDSVELGIAPLRCKVIADE